MRLGKRGLRDIGLVAAALIVLVAPTFPAHAQEAVTRDDIIKRLSGLEATPDLNVAALRQRALERVKSKADAVPLKRPPIATELLELPRFMVEVQFDPDASTIRPESYQTLGRIADALCHSTLLRYGFLIVGRTDATGKREYNLTLSQKRADSIRDALVNTFKISSKRLQAVGLGEEQLQDAARPAAAINQQVQVVTVAKPL
ncbi:MAG TPA: OmpA family protein [Bradyrhizobium sp.]|jgi:outer membrane protein OmpA-like peptidoglycan-associated protein|nr:OmpA family protein [Bradyrhizobium sp.]